MQVSLTSSIWAMPNGIQASHYVKFLSKTSKQWLNQAQYERATCPKEQLELKFVYHPLRRREEEQVNAIVMFSQS